MKRLLIIGTALALGLAWAAAAQARSLPHVGGYKVIVKPVEKAKGA